MSPARGTPDDAPERQSDAQGSNDPPDDARSAQEQRIRRIVTGTCAVLVGILAVVAISATRDRTLSSSPGTDSSLDAVQTFEVSQDHVTSPVTYAQTPPVGGQHAPIWLTCGVYDDPVPNENAVHALEHGAVWVTYRPDLSAAQVQRLRQAMPDTYVVLSPFPGLPAPVVASAWGKQLTLTGPDDQRLATFIRAYRQGPQSPEPGATCEAGVGEPSGAA